MTTLEEILNDGTTGSRDKKTKDTLAWVSEQNNWEDDKNTTSDEKETTIPEEKEETTTTPVYDGTESLYDWVKNSEWGKRNPSPILTQEQQEEERKKERRQKTMAAISDGISALSNLYFTTKGAPNMYSPSSTQSATVESRWDKLKKERKAEGDNWYDRMMKAYTADSTAKIRQRNAELAEEKNKRDADLSKAQLDVYNERAAYYKAQAQRQQAIADAEADRQAAEIEWRNAKTAEAKASAQAKLKAAEAARIRALRGGNSEGEFSAWDEDGNEHKFKTKTAADNYAKQQNTYNNGETVTEKYGVQSKTTSPTGGYAAPPKKKEKESTSSGNNNTSEKKKGFASDLKL